MATLATGATATRTAMFGAAQFGAARFGCLFRDTTNAAGTGAGGKNPYTAVIDHVAAITYTEVER